MGSTSQSGLPPNRRPQAPGLSPTGPLNLAGPPKMPSAMNGRNTSRPAMGGMGRSMGMPVAPPMGGRMPVAPDGQTNPGGQMAAPPPPMVAPPMEGGGTEGGFGGGKFGTDAFMMPPGYGQVQPPPPGLQRGGMIGGRGGMIGGLGGGRGIMRGRGVY